MSEQDIISIDDLISFILEITHKEQSDNENTTQIQTPDKQVEVKNDVIDIRTLKSIDLNELPDELGSIVESCKDNYYGRYVMKSEINTSLYHSVLLCIDEKFIDLNEDIQKLYIHRLLHVIEVYFTDIFRQNNYRRKGFTKKILLKQVNSYENTNMVIKILSDFMSINILVLDWSDEKVYIYYAEKTFNKHKPSIILVKKENMFYPIVNDTASIFWNNDPLFDTLTCNSKNLHIPQTNCKKPEEKVFLNEREDLSSYYQEIEKVDDKLVEKVDDKLVEKLVEKLDETKKVDVDENKFEQIVNDNTIEESSDDVSDIEDGSDNEDDNSEDNIECSKIFYKNKPKKVDLDSVNNKMKLSQLQKIAKQMKISLYLGKYKNGSFKYKTKQQLCKDINSKIVIS
jgi:hypothetical protein